MARGNHVAIVPTVMSVGVSHSCTSTELPSSHFMDAFGLFGLLPARASGPSCVKRTSMPGAWAVGLL